MSEIKVMTCENCGATLDFDSKSVMMVCAFCGSKFVVEIPETEEDKALKENAEVLLFQVEKKEAKVKFSEWIKGGFFKPSNLASSFKQKEFEGVYIPFFRVKADADTTWNGRDKIETRAATENEPAEYEYRERSGDNQKSYKDYITASKGLEQHEVDWVLPFDDNDAKPYETQLLMEYKSEKPAIKQDNAVDKAKERIREKEKRECSSKVDELLDTSTEISSIVSKLIMLPLWILVYSYNDKAYRVIINGQTGKIRGEKPVSKIKVLLFTLFLGAVGAGAYFAYKAL